MKTLYPEIEPYQTFFLATGSEHSIYVELSGNANGLPVIFLHGGPGSGIGSHHRRFFNPAKFKIILFDQRACGQSLPFGELKHNITQDLINDMELIRINLEIKAWVLFGGSWGGTLALLYAQQHNGQVLAMIIRGLFLARKQDLNWFAQNGVNQIYPEKWQQLLDAVATKTNENLIPNLCNVLWGKHELDSIRAAKAWMAWSGQVALGRDFKDDQYDSKEQVKRQVLQVRLEMHYARNHYFLAENQILEASDMLNSIPTIIIHGRYDLVCPIEAAYQLKRIMQHAEFWVLPTAGHVAKGNEMINALVSASDKTANNFSR